jgi:hypothetical protein
VPNNVDITVTSTDRTGPGVDSATANVKKLSGAVSSAGQTMKGVVAADELRKAADAVKDFVNDSINAASNLEQSVGGTEAVFKEASGRISDFAKTSAESVGLSENDFRNFTTVIGGQLKRMTGDIDFAAGKSIELSQIAADLAATYGGTTKEAMEAFSAALRGEADPAERFNLNLKVGVVQAKAVELGLAKSTKEVSQAAMAQATYALITDQAKDALGQFNRETDTAAHKQQVANAEMENAKAALGEGLLPIFSAAADAVGKIAKGFGELPGPVQEAITVVAGLGAAYAVLVPKIIAVKTATKELGITMQSTKAFIAGPWGLAIGAAIALVTAFTIAQHDSAAEAQALSEQLDFQKGAFDENNRKIIAAKLEEEGLLKTARELGISTETLTSAILGDADARKELNIHTIALNKNSSDAVVKHMQFNTAVTELMKTTDEASKAQTRKTTATKSDTIANQSNVKTIDDQIAAMKQQAKAVQDQFDPMAKLIHAQQTVAEKQKDLTEAIKKHGKHSDAAKQAELDLAAAILDSGTAAADVVEKFNGKLDPALRQILKQGGLTASQIKDIEKQFVAAKKAGDKFATTYDAQANVTFQVHGLGSIRFDAEGNPVRHAPAPKKPATHHAAGGVIGAGAQTYNPSEEIAQLPSGTTILPRGASQAMLNGMSGGSNKLQIEMILPRATGFAFLDAIIEGIRYKVGTDGNNDPVTYLKR